MKTIGGYLAVCVFLFTVVMQSEVCVAQVAFKDSHLSRFIGINDGLPSDFIDDIMFDDAGFMWIATSGGGLCRYDGYEFNILATGTDPELKSNFVRNVVEDRFRRLWIGTEWGVEIFDIASSSMITVPGTEETAFDLLKGNPCSYITIDARGNVWAKSGANLVCLEFSDDGRVSEVSSMEDVRLEPIAMVFKDVEGNGSVWVGMEGVVYRISPSDYGNLIAVPALDDFSFNPLTLVTDFLVKDQDVWIATIDGLIRFDMVSGIWKLYTTDPDDDRSLSQNYISGLTLTPDKRLLAITLKGANIYSPIEDGFERITMDDGRNGSGLLSSNFLNCVCVHGQDIWIGTESAGLIQVKLKRLAVTNLYHDNSDPASIAPNPVNAVCQTPDGMVWVGTVESGLSYSKDPKAGFGHITAADGRISHNSVSSIVPARDGNLWIGTWGGGVDVLSGNLPYPRIAKPVWAGSVADRIDYVGTLMEDTLNNLMWIGSNSGIYYCDLNTYQVYSALEVQTTGCLGSCLDNTGRLWMGCQDGLYIFDLVNPQRTGTRFEFRYTNQRFTLNNPDSGIPDKIVSIMQASDGTMWLGSNGNGLYRSVESFQGDMSFENINVREGLPNNVVKCIEEDEQGNMWISTANGLAMLSLHDMRFLTCSVEQGLRSSQFYWNASCACADGTLCFGTVDGLSIIDPSRNYYQFPPLNLCITKTAIGGKVNYSPYQNSMTLHERDRSILFSFSTLNYATTSRISYLCRVEGLDSQWYKFSASDNTVVYSSFPAGDYILQVKALGAPGSAEDIFSMPIHVKPYFRHTWASRILVLLIVWIVILVWHKRRTKFLVRQKDLLQRTVDERTSEIQAQKLLIEQKAEELDRQNAVLKRQVEELAGNKLIIAQENMSSEDSKEDGFKIKVMETVRSLYNDPDLDVATFCQTMGMSKTIVNKRLQETLGHSVVSLIRTYRLTVAREMIVNNRETGGMNISEIAYECGFNDPKYFTRCFTKEFGVAPSSVVST